MKRRAFLALVGRILPVVAVAPVLLSGSPRRPYSYYEDGPQSAFGLAPVKREGSSVRYDSMSEREMEDAIIKFMMEKDSKGFPLHSPDNVEAFKEAVIARFG